MNHAAIVQAESERLYANRNYILHKLDDRHFDVLNQTPVKRDENGYLYEVVPAPILALNGYCLDALDESPQGCMADFVNRPAQCYTVRGRTWAEIESGRKHAELLIAEMLAEIKAEEG